MSAKTHLGFAAFVASIAALFIPICTGLWYFFGPPILNADGSPDNAPVRSAALLLFASPVFLLLLSAYYAIAPVVVQRIHRRTLGALVVFNLVPSSGLALLLGVQGLRAFGLLDGAISFGLFGLFSITFLTVGSVAWWLIAPPQAHTPVPKPPAV